MIPAGTEIPPSSIYRAALDATMRRRSGGAPLSTLLTRRSQQQHAADGQQ